MPAEVGLPTVAEVERLTVVVAVVTRTDKKVIARRRLARKARFSYTKRAFHFVVALKPKLTQD
jgi:hypothetical protein